MRTPCKYAHQCLYNRYANGRMCNVAVTECWAVKEPFECNNEYRELCGIYKPLYDVNLEWQHKRNTDGTWYGVCTRCGWRYELVEANYCPHCGYEYKPWDGTVFK